MPAVDSLGAAAQGVVDALLAGFFIPCRKSLSALPVAVHAERLEQRVLLSTSPAAFQPQQTFATGFDPYSVASADVNRDGKMDLVVANSSGQFISVLLGIGDGSFQPQATFASGSAPRSIAVADVNRDGKPDVIAANTNDNTVGILLGNGDGTFQAQTTLATGANPFSVAIADVNRDGKPDLEVANFSSGTIGVLLGNGDGTFKPQATFPTGSIPRAVAVSDVNRDGKPDLIVANYKSSTADIGVLLGNGDGTFQHQNTFSTGFPDYVTVADVNGDGKPDVIAANYFGNSLSVLLGNGDGTLKPQVSFATGFRPYSVAVADLNGDGILDLATANNRSSNASVLLGNGDGTFQPQFTFGVGSPSSGPSSITASDFNGDGTPDLAITSFYNSSVSVRLGDAAPVVTSISRASPAGDTTSAPSVAFAVTFSKPVTGVDATDFALATTGTVAAGAPVVTGSGAAYTVTVNNITGGGTIGLNLLNDGSIKTPLGVGLKTLSTVPKTSFATVASPNSNLLADFNRDGNLDVINSSGNSNGPLGLLLGNGNGTFASVSTFAGPSGLGGLAAAADLNGDGKLDLIDTSFSGSKLSVMLGNGDGTFQPPSTYAAAPGSAVVADLNGDGKPDLASADFLGHTVSVLLGNGDGTFKPQVTFAVGQNPVGIMALDANLDGFPDLVVANTQGNTLSLLLGNGDGTFKPQATLAAGSFPQSPEVADVNDDGKPDLIDINTDGSSISVQLGNGDGTFKPQLTFATDADPISLAVADWTADGKPDLLVVDQLAGHVNLLAGNGNGTFRPQVPFAVDAGTEELAVADINKDGTSDIVATNYNGNSESVFRGTTAATFIGQTYTISAAHFDFGTASSPVAPGYTRVSEATAFSAPQGYGWQTAPAGSRDRGTADPLARDFDFTNSTGSTFAANLPNGTYSVTIKLGDATTKRDNQGIYLEGTQVANVTTIAGQVYTNTYDVTVNDGQLNLLLKDLGGNDGFAVIDSLDIAPAVPAHFDFGTTTSPVAAGYTRISEATLFSTATAYGWLTAPLGSRDRGAVSGTTALTQDFDYTNSAGSTFAVNLPNGTYNVTVTLGDATTRRDSQGIFLEGTQVDTVTTNAGQFFTKTYAVTVANGQLTLMLKDLGGNDPYAIIDGLDIVGT